MDIPTVLRTVIFIVLSIIIWPIGILLYFLRMFISSLSHCYSRTVLRTFSSVASTPTSSFSSPLMQKLFSQHVSYKQYNGIHLTTSSSSSSSSSSSPLSTPPPIHVIELKGIKTELQIWENPTSTSTSGSSNGTTRGTSATGGITTTVPPKVFFFMFPGNPGCVDFYIPYMTMVHELSRQTTNPFVCVTVGHASHSVRTASTERFNLQQQVQHKINVINYFLEHEPNAYVILAGHSVGSYMALEVARQLPSPDKFLAGILLFPTVMHIGSTVNGKKLMPLFRFGRSLLWFAAAVASLLPYSVKSRLASLQLPAGSNKLSVESCLSIIHPDVAYNTLWMALHEMKEMLDLDVRSASLLQSKLIFYFGVDDNWVGPDHPDKLRKLLPKANIIECQEGHKHAFVLETESVTRMANLTWSWIQPVVNNGLSKN